MRRKRKPPKRYRKQRLTIRLILTWIDAYHELHGRWPHHFSGRIEIVPDETWSGVEAALKGGRGLPGGSSLARVLYLYRAVRSPGNVPELNARQILGWIRSHHRRTGKWPTENSGPIHDAPGETWVAIDLALRRGRRGLPGGSSLAQLLHAKGLQRNLQQLPDFKPRLILAWADAHFKAFGHYPYRESGPIPESPGDTWGAVHKALVKGRRGLPGGSSLAAFLNEHRGIYPPGMTRRRRPIPEAKRLSLERIARRMKSHRRRTGAWPNRHSGPIAGADGLKWSTLDSALKNGFRGLPGGFSLAELRREITGEKGGRGERGRGR